MPYLSHSSYQRSSYDGLSVEGWQKAANYMAGRSPYRYNPTYGFGMNGERKSSTVNYYHKPQLSLNYQWDINPKSSLSAVLYMSRGYGFGTMGFGLGAAIGAQMGNPDKRVIHVTGDGCFRMNCHELCTVEHYGLPIISVVFNNGTLGMVRQWQNLIYGKRFSETPHCWRVSIALLSNALVISLCRSDTTMPILASVMFAGFSATGSGFILLNVDTFYCTRTIYLSIDWPMLVSNQLSRML